MPSFDKMIDLGLDVAYSPALWLGAGIVLVSSVLFLVWQRGGLRQWGRDLLAAIAGFIAGQLVGRWLPLDWQQVGSVHMFWGVAGAAVAMVLGRRFFASLSAR